MAIDETTTSSLMERADKTGYIRKENAGSPIHPRASEVIVIPSWQADRYISWLRLIFRAISALYPYLLLRRFICVPRILTRLNSAATKNPFNSTNNMANRRKYRSTQIYTKLVTNYSLTS